MDLEKSMISKNFIVESGDEKEKLYRAGEETLRIDLRDDDISLWRYHLAAQPCQVNMLLACESSKGDLLETQLTWIVGAAIRSSLATGSEHAKNILKALGVKQQLLDIVGSYCIGLGEATAWAFYLDRTGTLTASPIDK